MKTRVFALIAASLLALAAPACSSSGGGSNGHGGSGSGGSASSAGPTGGGNDASCGAAASPCCAGDVCSDGLACQGGVCAQQRPTETGKTCAKNSDCMSGVCLPVGDGRNACTAACVGAADCLPGWSCGALLGQPGNVCQCTAHAETCDGKDNDCNGIVDDEPAVDADCKASSSTSVCSSGACGCAPENQCGGACPDTSSDPTNCGGCGRICSKGASCVDRACQCPGSPVVCGGACVGVSTDYHLCNGACAKNTDAGTCGASCTPCPGAPDGTATCDGVSCGIECDAGYVQCGSSCCENCQTAGCQSSQYCDATSGLCQSGCAHNTQCASSSFCDVPDHDCVVSVAPAGCPAGYTYQGTCSDGREFCTSSKLPSGTTFPWQTPCPAGTTSRGAWSCGGYTNQICVPNN